MKTPFWRCVLVSLLLWTLPLQWLAAAVALPCAVQARANDDAVTVAMAPVQNAVPGQVRGHSHDHRLLALAQAHAGADVAHGDASDHGHAKCTSVGHCCVGAVIPSAALPDFAGPSASADFAPLTQRHRAPVLSGPDRPPQTRQA